MFSIQKFEKKNKKFVAQKITCVNKGWNLLNPYLLKFGLSEKHTKFEKNLPHGFDKSADLLSKSQIMCASRKGRTLTVLLAIPFKKLP